MLAAVAHTEPDRLPVDFGSSNITGMHVSVMAALRRYYGLGNDPVKVIEPGQMLGEIAPDLKEILGIDTQGLWRLNTRYGFPTDNWKSWRLYDGLEVLVPGGFNVTIDANGDTLLYPEGDTSAPPSARMPQGGYFFDNITRQEPIVEERLDPRDNLEEYGPISESELDFLETAAREARATGRAVLASFGGTALGDISQVAGVALKHPRGIRDVTEWYVSTRTRRDYIHAVFSGQVEVALGNLERIAARVGANVDVAYLCGTDFGTQTSSFCSVATFRELWFPYYKRINDWVHTHTGWKTFKHCCGSAAKFIPSFIEAGFDILNPVQCSAANMEPERLKSEFGDRIVFWGGGVDTQQVLPFGTPAQVREQVLARCEVFAPGGGFVFNSVHNVQACTPVENVAAMFDAVKEFNGRRG
ncbi:MAG TPA: uroporphyrinogen decarboxylase family protein [Bryobacteraceae bacterium]|nr:uroporphyrinogen decarboxylase family protein [Bryobacteraceae bacterium]